MQEEQPLTSLPPTENEQRFVPPKQEIERELLLEPLNPTRDSIDEEKFGELVASIKLSGIIQPLLVQIEGDRYRIQAGHRRYLASAFAELKTLPCLVYPEGMELGDHLQFAENRFREDPKPADEARWFAKVLIEKCENDVDKLCVRLGEKRGYVEGRLNLLNGDQEVFAALAQEHIGVGVAKELNLIRREDLRRTYLDLAIRTGTKEKVIREWRIAANAMDVPANPGGLNEMSGSRAQEPVTGYVPQCVICGGTDEPHEMEYLAVHRSCKRAQDRLAARQREEMNNGQ